MQDPKYGFIPVKLIGQYFPSFRCRGTFLQVCSVNEQFENSEDKHQRKSGEVTESDGPKVTHFL